MKCDLVMPGLVIRAGGGEALEGASGHSEFII